MSRRTESAAHAPQPVGPYSQGVAWEKLVYTAGQVAIDPASGQGVPGGVDAQTRQVLENLRAILEAAGARMDTVLKTTCFLTDINDFAEFNGVYREYFPEDPPARSTIEAGLVPPWRVEIEAVAVLDTEATD